MKKSHVDPGNREKTTSTTVERSEELCADRTECIATLERAIETLKELGHPETREKIDKLIKLFEWALADLRETDPDAPVDPERVVAIDCLLQRCR